MFLILYLLDSLSPFEVGLLFAVNYAISFLLDYPTGALGDILGHRQVLVISYCFHVFSIFFLLFADSFIIFLIYISLSAIASSQESGALNSWFDNQYHYHTSTEDPNRNIYKSFQARNFLLVAIVSGIAFTLGGLISAISRIFLFQLYLFFTLFNLVLIIRLINRIPDQINKVSFSLYWSQIKLGVKFLVSKKSVFLYFIGSAIIFSADISLWGTLFLFPVYEIYSGGSDDITGLIRSIVFLTGVIWGLMFVRYISRFKREYFWTWLAITIDHGLFYLLILGYTIYFPPQQLIDYVAIVGIVIVFQIPGFWQQMHDTLRNRINLDLVPDNIRNSVYSLIPTLITLIGIPIVPFVGFIIGEYGFNIGLVVTAGISFIGSIIAGIGLFLLSRQ